MSNTPIVAALNRESPAIGAVAVTPSDSADLGVAPARALWVGTAGDVRVAMANGDVVTIKAPQGPLPFSVRRVYDTGTTAADILAIY